MFARLINSLTSHTDCPFLRHLLAHEFSVHHLKLERESSTNGLVHGEALPESASASVVQRRHPHLAMPFHPTPTSSIPALISPAPTTPTLTVNTNVAARITVPVSGVTKVTDVEGAPPQRSYLNATSSTSGRTSLLDPRILRRRRLQPAPITDRTSIHLFS